MTTEDLIRDLIASQPERKRSELAQLDAMIREVAPEAKLWYLDGKDESGKTVANPNIGYGSYTISYANGTKREFYRIGLSPNKTGISVYVMGIGDKHLLETMFGARLGKATITGYCILFKSIKDIDLDVLREAIAFGLG